jgi:hypothetical protein
MAQPIWSTPSGSVGSFPSGISLSVTLSAAPVLPATSISYIFLSGVLPQGIIFDSSGEISGTTSIVPRDITYTFSIRAIDNLGSLRDRTFSMSISGASIPQFITPEGNILSIQDSNWVELPIEISNPNTTNPIYVEVKEGILPPGLEINEVGIIRGYADPPVINFTASEITTLITASDATNSLTCISTTGFFIGRPIIFTGTSFGGIVEGLTYYIKTISNSTSFTISSTQDGPVVELTTDIGIMTALLPAVTVGQPTIRTYSFVLKLLSPLGNDLSSYSITIINQNAAISIGGPGFLPNTRTPTLLNTRPRTFNISQNDLENFGYYIVPPPNSAELTLSPSSPASMGRTESSNYFSFRILGYDFDGNLLNYQYSGLPSFLMGDISTGWITGNPTLATQGISEFNFTVRVFKLSNPSIISLLFNFSLIVSNDINGTIVWLTPGNLGNIFNGTVSSFNVRAVSDVALLYRIVDGSLPPNLTLLNNGEITGYVANQPTDALLEVGDSTTFDFTIEAYSTTYSLISLTKEFNIIVQQRYGYPTDTLYIKATPSIEDREILASLLNNEEIIPTAVIYRPTDINFGKATNVVYEHAYGIYASDVNQYLLAVTQNHYWRNITLGEIKTAVAKNNAGEIIYEVVYSEVIDNLINPEGISIPETIIWPRLIPLFLGPYWTSVVNIYTSWIEILNQEYYTSLTPGFARTLHPNSLYNMRERVGQVLGQEYDSSLLPLWMTSQQANGSTLGYTQAWVICYTKPGFSKTVANNIENIWIDPVGRNYTLNQINFQIDRFSVDKSITYNFDNTLDPPAWTDLPSATPPPNPIDSDDFYVLFPRKTILPDQTEY